MTGAWSTRSIAAEGISVLGGFERRSRARRDAVGALASATACFGEIASRRECDAHPPLFVRFGLAEKTQIGFGHGQSVRNVLIPDAASVHTPVDDRRSAGHAQAYIDRQAKDGAR